MVQHNVKSTKCIKMSQLLIVIVSKGYSIISLEKHLETISVSVLEDNALLDSVSNQIHVPNMHFVLLSMKRKNTDPFNNSRIE